MLLLGVMQKSARNQRVIRGFTLFRTVGGYISNTRQEKFAHHRSGVVCAAKGISLDAKRVVDLAVLASLSLCLYQS
jgi:hypothetical protein